MLECLRNHTTFPTWNPHFTGYQGPLQEEIFVIYNQDGDRCKNSYELDPELYRSYLDPHTGFIYSYKCYFCIFLAGVKGLGASLVRPLMIVGVEIADLAYTKKFKIVKRIQNIARAVLYAMPMFFCALGTALMPFSTFFWTKLSALEFFANRGIHKIKSLREANDRDKFVLYLTDQPRGHFTQMREDGYRAKYKLLDLYNNDGEATQLDHERRIIKGFTADLIQTDQGYEVKLWKRQLRGDDKVQIECTIGKLIKFLLDYYNYDESSLTLMHVTDIGVHFEEHEGINVMEYVDENTHKDNPIVLRLTPKQEAELKALKYPFLNVEPLMSYQKLWLQIKERITSLP